MQTQLLTQKCIPCNIGTPTLKPDEINKLSQQLKLDWQVKNNAQIHREFVFKDFKEALDFVNKVAELAEEEGHHPDLYIHDYKKVLVELMTHKIKGLSENDFILAAKIENLISII